ncbi:MAG: bifunctional hydroxymethylpyrimidine kinase/phosphomethylpyrimidine kinase [candidate division KSB1 bacterium]|nr:bifunctional hydroxymethylpyrimidine kinase/phosphomethylpyrimidine kinase [candidate division KSB1 bacterium]
MEPDRNGPVLVLTIAGSDSGGGAGIQADLKTMSAFGVYGMTVITSVTAQNTRGVQGIWDLPPEFVGLQLDSVLSDLGAHAVKTGMLSNREIIRVVAERLRRYAVPHLVVDPVMVAKSGDPLLRDDARHALISEILPLAELVTPNIPEAQVLAGVPVRTPADMKEAALRIRELGPRNVLVKGGHLEGEAIDILWDGQNFHEYRAPRLDQKHTHGTGCTYSAAIASCLAKGFPLLKAVEIAKRYITLAIREGLALGSGYGPVNHLVPVSWD